MEGPRNISPFEILPYKRIFPDDISFSDTQLAWLVLSRNLQLDGHTVVLGSYPLPEDDMAYFAGKLGMNPQPLSPDFEYLIIGWNDWEPEDLRKLLKMRRGKTLTVYSQELLLAYAISGSNPFDYPKFLDDLAELHPALHFLKKVPAFDWPTTKVSGNCGDMWPIEGVVEKGYLKYVGYTVGKKGLSQEKRRKLLNFCYLNGIVPSVFGSEYRDGWGKPKTSTRLQKMANSIAAFCVMAKKREPPPDIAIGHWEEDLQHLKFTYYDGRLLFGWPTTDVW